MLYPVSKYPYLDLVRCIRFLIIRTWVSYAVSGFQVSVPGFRTLYPVPSIRTWVSYAVSGSKYPYLGFVELQGRGNFNTPGPSEVLVEVELLLQLRQLLRGEVGAAGIVDAAGTRPAVETLRFRR
jgi:hypothetical protein